MNHRLIQERIAAELAERTGWAPHPQNDHHFEHADTDVHILVYGAELSVTFGEILTGQHKALGVKTALYPKLAIASVLEVADALVEVRQLAKWRAETAVAWEQAFEAGDEPGPGPG